MTRANLQIKVGTYTGDGTDNRNITGVGFKPDLVWLKGGSNHAVFRSKTMRGDSTGYLSLNSANLADSIQELQNDGFQVGTSVTANETASVYYYMAIRGASGQSHFTCGNYLGTGGDNRNYITGGINFTPDLVGLKGDRADHSSASFYPVSTDLAQHFGSPTDAANEIQNRQSGGFQLGTSTRANANGSEYHFWAMKMLSGVMSVGSVVSDGKPSLKVTGLGFQPSMVFLKNANSSGRTAFMKTSDMTTTTAVSFSAGASSSTVLTSLDSDGFTVGSSSTSGNGTAGDTLYYWALKAGNFNAPVTRLTA